MRTKRRVGGSLVLAIILGFLGTWALNPDTGVLFHDTLLWHIVGVIAEFDPAVLLLVVLVDAAIAASRGRHITQRRSSCRVSPTRRSAFVAIRASGCGVGNRRCERREAGRSLRRVIRQPRRLTDHEIEALLACDVVASLASIDADGFPHITPLWFVWTDGSFWMTSFADRPHLRRLEQNPQAGVLVATEAEQRPDGERPNQQVRAIGRVTLAADHDDAWTRRVREKYLGGPHGTGALARETDAARIVISLRPERLVAVASV